MYFYCSIKLFGYIMLIQWFLTCGKFLTVGKWRSCQVVKWGMTGWQGWQYGTVRSEFAYYVPGTLNRTSVPYFSSSFEAYVPTYRTRTNTKKTYRTNVPYFLAEIEAYRTIPTYRTVLPFLQVGQKNTATKFNASHIHMLTYFTNHNHLKTVLITKTTNYMRYCKSCLGKSVNTVL